MRLTRGFEQGICIMALLATQQPGIPVASQAIHSRLQGSATYIKKLTRKLVVAGLVTSVSGNNGGFTLARDTNEITLLEVVEALEGEVDTFPDSGLINNVFGDMQGKAEEGGRILQHYFREADQRWRSFLATITVNQIMHEILGEEMVVKINWNEHTETHELLIRKVLKKYGYDKKRMESN